MRRDILELEAQGAPRRVHGGVVTTAAHAEPLFAQRQHLRAREKRAIARAVLPMLAPGQVILMDAGTTTGYLAEALCGMAGLTIITNSLGIAMTLARRAGAEASPAMKSFCWAVHRTATCRQPMAAARSTRSRATMRTWRCFRPWD